MNLKEDKDDFLQQNKSILECDFPWALTLFGSGCMCIFVYVSVSVGELTG